VSEDPHPPEASPLDRAEEIVARIELEVAQRAQRLIVRAVEEAQDIWAEAQALRHEGRPE
jgi:hypothetical protein